MNAFDLIDEPESSTSFGYEEYKFVASGNSTNVRTQKSRFSVIPLTVAGIMTVTPVKRADRFDIDAGASATHRSCVLREMLVSDSVSDVKGDFFDSELCDHSFALAVKDFLIQRGFVPTKVERTADESAVFEFGEKAPFFLDVYKHGTVVAVMSRGDHEEYYEFSNDELGLLYDLLHAGTLPV